MTEKFAMRILISDRRAGIGRHGQPLSRIELVQRDMIEALVGPLDDR